MPNYYEILGVGRDATDVEIKKAYRSLSLQWHPDRNSAPEANAKFQEISEAYETLSDSDKKSQYDDELNGVMRNPFGPGEDDIANIFNMMFAGGMPGMGMPGGIHVFHTSGGMGMPGMGMPGQGMPGQGMPGQGMPGMFNIFHQVQKPPPIIKNIRISFAQAYVGCTIHLPIEKWYVRDQLRITEMETVYVSIPAGVDDGEVIVMRDCGNTVNEQLKGDIKIVVGIENNTPFLRHGMDLIYKKTITLKEALTGGTFDVVHVNGKTLCFNNTTNRTIIRPGYKKMIPGLGMVRDSNSGNLFIEFSVEFPEKLTEDQIEKLAEIL
jgi:DnaJ-class molecular chaperone